MNYYNGCGIYALSWIPPKKILVINSYSNNVKKRHMEYGNLSQMVVVSQVNSIPELSRGPSSTRAYSNKSDD